MRQFFVYIMANRSRTLYVGITNDLARRVWEHKHMQTEGFTRRYLIDRLVYYEPAATAEAAILREKQIKAWVRRRKIALIESVNPRWRDLSLDFLDIRQTVSMSPLASQNTGRRDSSLPRSGVSAKSQRIQHPTADHQREAQNDGDGV